MTLTREELEKKMKELARGIIDKEAERVLIANMGALARAYKDMAVEDTKVWMAGGELINRFKEIYGRPFEREEFKTVWDIQREYTDSYERYVKDLTSVLGGLNYVRKEGWEKHYSSPSPAWLLLPVAVAAGMLAGWLRGRRPASSPW